ncbi:hypothetical protein RQP46_010508 [Phenoliferia psychrophenolica]
MRSFSCLALALATLAIAKPLTDERKTSVHLDRNPTLLEAGEVVVHVLRTDDLLSDYTPSHERSLILSRVSHIAVRVQLDPEASTLAINDEAFDLQSLVAAQAGGAAPKVQVVKASAYHIPKDQRAGRKSLSSADLEGFADLVLPQGIVSVELSIEEDKSESAPIAVPDAGPVHDATVSMRAFKVFVKITEIEHQQISHSTTILVPILEVHLTYADDSTKPVSLKAFAIRPKKTFHHHGGEIEDGPRHHRGGDIKDGPRHRPKFDEERRPIDDRPHHRRPHAEEDSPEDVQFDFGDDSEDLHYHGHHSESDEGDDQSRMSHRNPSHRRPEQEDGEVDVDLMGHSRPQGRPPHLDEGHERHSEVGEDHHHGRRPFHGPPAFVRWIADVLGFAPPPPPPHFRHHSHPHSFHPHSHSDPHSIDSNLDVESEPTDEFVEGEGDSDVPPPPRSHFRHSQEHPHHPHHFHPHHRSSTMFVFLCILAIITKLALVGSVGFFAVRKIWSVIKARHEARGGAVALSKDAPEESEKPLLPRYESLEAVVVEGEKA